MMIRSKRLSWQCQSDVLHSAQFLDKQMRQLKEIKIKSGENIIVSTLCDYHLKSSFLSLESITSFPESFSSAHTSQTFT